MSDGDKAVNARLAMLLLRNHVKKQVGTHLDIGSKYPFLGHCFTQMGFTSYAVDGIPAVIPYSTELGVKGYQFDFEKDPIPKDFPKFDIITLVHCMEHLYTPVQTLKKIQKLLKEDGVLFVRSPASDVEGIERDMTKPHFEIHPTVYCEDAALTLFKKAGLVCYENYPVKPGQRDYLLRRAKSEQV